MIEYEFNFPMIVFWPNNGLINYGIATETDGNGNFIIPTNTKSFFTQKVPFSKIGNTDLERVHWAYDEFSRTTANIFRMWRYLALVKAIQQNPKLNTNKIVGHRYG